MASKYFDLIDQTFYFPQEGFDLEEGYLTFNDIPLRYYIDKYGTPLRITYLPRIGKQIKRGRNLFNKAMNSLGYAGKYYYCYCTKSNHFAHVVEEALRYGVQLELSSAYDVELVKKLYSQGKINRNTKIICNGFKTEDYLRAIVDLSFVLPQVVAVLDNASELVFYEDLLEQGQRLNIGLRLATEEEPTFEFYTSRLGMRRQELLELYQARIAGNPKFDLKMLHFFVDTGINDSLYYWGELRKATEVYVALRQQSESLSALNIGGGMPIRNSLGFEFDYKYMVREIVNNIMEICRENALPEPDIYTEFGKYTVGESSAHIFSVLEQKQQNDSELWYMIDGSLMTTLPDAWGIGERFILLPINKWQNPYRRVNIGGLSCDNSDYYNSEVHESQVFLPVIEPNTSEPLYIGFFHTGAYQDSISGYGGIKHCLIPTPRHIILDVDSKGHLTDRELHGPQSVERMLEILGY
ncbi:MAG: arginine decarboxylase [Bacteroidota bacterium]